jgi:hypothetical protein
MQRRIEERDSMHQAENKDDPSHPSMDDVQLLRLIPVRSVMIFALPARAIMIGVQA